MVTPWIFEPSHNNKVGQKTNIINGVPEPAIKRKVAERIAIMDASRATLVLNQRLSKRIINKPRKRPIIMLGNLTE